MNFSANWIYLIGFEMALVLLVACFIFLGHIRNLRKLISALEERVVNQRDTLRTTRATFDALKDELAAQRNARVDYSDALAEQLEVTRNRHASLSPDRDIILDITSGTPLERQVLALRHAFLIAEQEAALAADNKGVDWDVLEAKLAQIIDFYQQPAVPDLDIDDQLDIVDDMDTIDVDAGSDGVDEDDDHQKRHIANLEKFRQLYFDVERKWREARGEAEKYHQELSALGRTLGASEEFDALLQQYVQVYAGVDGLLEGGGREPDAEGPSVGRIVIANQEEIQRLRNMAVDQHKIIVELKRKLVDADSLEEKDRLIEEMQAQLDRNERFLKESDTCIQQLENDVHQLMAENQQLKVDLENRPAAGVEPAPAAANNEELDMLRGLVSSFTEQSRDMLGAIAVLEQDNRRLMAEVPEKSGTEVAAMSARLTQSQQELLKLQTQYLELEERYLELKMQAG